MPREIGWIRLALVGVMVGATPSASAAIPPPPDAMTADCERPVYATDKLVCSTPDLRAQDDAMRGLLSQVPTHDLAGRAPFLESQDAWLGRRSLCAFKADHLNCAKAAYAERLSVLRVLRAGSPSQRRAVHCTPGKWVRPALAEDANRSIVLFDHAGSVMAVAFPASTGAWQPFASYWHAGGTWTFRTASGTAVRCR